MKKNVAALVLAFTSLYLSNASIAISAPSKQADNHHANFSSAPRVVIHMRHVSMPRPAPIQHSSNVVRDQRHVARPTVDGNGTKITQQEVRTPPAHMMIVQNSTLQSSISREKQTETQQNHYYWHTANGVNYAHYRDDTGTDWYGFYHKDSFYWTRHYANRWWWYDANYARWVFWAEGFWWWLSPDNYLYVYTNDNYYPYDESIGGVTVIQPEVQQPPSDIPPANEGKIFASPDNRRMVQIDGATNQAFLYDTTAGQPTFMKYLGENVASVEYSSRSSAKPLQILIHFNDGSFALFDADGNSLEPPTPPTGSDALVDAPEEVPPAPVN